MKIAAYSLLAGIGLFFTLLFGVDGVYVGLIADQEELSQYPWSTELGWTYLNKYNYMVSGLLSSLLAWFPLFLFVTVRHLMNRPCCLPGLGLPAYAGHKKIKCYLTVIMKKLPAIHKYIFLLSVIVMFPQQLHAINYDFLVGSIELSDDYVIVSRSHKEKNMFSIVALNNVEETSVSTVITTMVYDYTSTLSTQITEDNAEEYLLKYITDSIVAHKKSLNITKVTNFRRTKVNDKLGLNTLYFAKTSADTDAVGVITVTYSKDSIVAFIVFQSGSLEIKGILSAINKFENYIPN